MAQYEVIAPKDRNVAVRAGGRHYVFLAGSKRVVEASGDVAGILEAHGCTARHVSDQALPVVNPRQAKREEDALAATFHAEKVAAAQAAPPEDLTRYAAVEEKVGAPEKSHELQALDSEEEAKEVGAPVSRFDAFTVIDLRQMAAVRGIPIPAGAKKADIVALLEASEPGLEQGGEEE